MASENVCDILWNMFTRTGHIGVYLLYRRCKESSDEEREKAVSQPSR